MTLNSEGLEKALEKAEQQAARHGDNVTCSSLNIGYDEVRLILSAARSHLSALPPVDGLEVVLEKICHKEQIGIWANEITSALALSDFLREEWTFDDSVDLEKEIAAQLRDIITSAFTHPGLDLVAALSQASSVIAGLRAERITAERDALDAYGKLQTAEARISSLEEENKRLDAELKKQIHRATNAEYMGWAYRSMLGEKGQRVTKAWDEKGVKRVHHSWGPDAAAMTGEERAQTLLDWEEAMKTAVPVESVDGGSQWLTR